MSQVMSRRLEQKLARSTVLSTILVCGLDQYFSFVCFDIEVLTYVACDVMDRVLDL